MLKSQIDLLVDAKQSVVTTRRAVFRRIMSLGPSRVSRLVNNICHGTRRGRDG